MDKNHVLLDLHVHTAVSDGDYSPEEIVQKAKDAKVGLIAIADHDTVSGVIQAINAGKKVGLKVIAGIEISCGKIHLLGYFIDVKNRQLLEYVKWKEKTQKREVQRILAIINQEGYKITLKEIKKLVPNKRIDEKEVGLALARKGYREFKGNAFQAKEVIKAILSMHASKALPTNIDVEKAITLIKKARGTVVWAHPFSKNDKEETIELLAEKLKNKGIDGIEVFNPTSSTPSQQKFLLKIAKKHRFIVSAGTDCHHKGDKIGVTAPTELLNWART